MDEVRAYKLFIMRRCYAVLWCHQRYAIINRIEQDVYLFLESKTDDELIEFFDERFKEMILESPTR
jgi:hypothetical protein